MALLIAVHQRLWTGYDLPFSFLRIYGSLPTTMVRKSWENRHAHTRSGYSVITIVRVILSVRITRRPYSLFIQTMKVSVDWYLM